MASRCTDGRVIGFFSSLLEFLLFRTENISIIFCLFLLYNYNRHFAIVEKFLLFRKRIKKVVFQFMWKCHQYLYNKQNITWSLWGYEFYLRVLKVSLTSERSERVTDTFSTRRDKIGISSILSCNILYIITAKLNFTMLVY